MHTRKTPRGARHLRTYAEFRSYLTDFAQGRYPFLWVVGRTGIEKTTAIQAAVRGHDVHYRKGGQLTPLQFYIDLYRHRGRPVILDDAEHLLENRVGAKLISSLGDTTPTKLLCYASTTRLLGDVPQSYYTTSPLCILANRATADEAVQSRAVSLFFDPTNLEVHRAVALWFWDQEVHDWFGQHLYRLPPLDVRWYVHGSQDNRAGRDWRQIVLKAHVPARAACVVQDLESDPAYPTREDKARRFTELMGTARGASRASYFRLRSRLEQADWLAVRVVAPIPLRRTRPPGIPSLLELDSMDNRPEPIEPEEVQPLDVSAREPFAQPIRGQIPTPQRPVLDDLLPWEVQAQTHEEDEE